MSDISKITERLEGTQEFLDQLGDHLDKNFRLVDANGKRRTIKQWKEFFHIKIPDEVNFMVLVDLASIIFAKYQTASYFRDKQIIQMSILEQTKSDKYNNAYQNARKENEIKFGKPLAADSCKIAASLEVKDIEDAIQNQAVVKDFWVKTCQTLTELRKLLETMGFALSGDARINKDFVIKKTEH